MELQAVEVEFDVIKWVREFLLPSSRYNLYLWMQKNWMYMDAGAIFRLRNGGLDTTKKLKLYRWNHLHFSTTRRYSFYVTVDRRKSLAFLKAKKNWVFFERTENPQNLKLLTPSLYLGECACFFESLPMLTLSLNKRIRNLRGFLTTSIHSLLGDWGFG